MVTYPLLFPLEPRAFPSTFLWLQGIAPLWVNPSSQCVYEPLVTVFHIQKEDINSGCSPASHVPLSVHTIVSLLVISPSLSLLQPPTTHSTASPITSAAFLPSPPSVSSISSTACASVSPLWYRNDGKKTIKNKTIWGKPILLPSQFILAPGERLTPACSLFFFFFLNSACVRCSCAQRQWQRCRHRGSCQTVDSLSYSSSGPRPALFYQVPTLSWLDVDHLSKHEEDGGGMGWREHTHTQSHCTKVHKDTPAKQLLL